MAGGFAFARQESESEPAAGAAAAPTQTWRKRLRLRPLKLPSVKLSVSTPAKTRPKAKDMAAMAKVRARVKAIAAKRHTASSRNKAFKDSDGGGHRKVKMIAACLRRRSQFIRGYSIVSGPGSQLRRGMRTILSLAL